MSADPRRARAAGGWLRARPPARRDSRQRVVLWQPSLRAVPRGRPGASRDPGRDRPRRLEHRLHRLRRRRHPAAAQAPGRARARCRSPARRAASRPSSRPTASGSAMSRPMAGSARSLSTEVARSPSPRTRTRPIAAGDMAGRWHDRLRRPGRRTCAGSPAMAAPSSPVRRTSRAQRSTHRAHAPALPGSRGVLYTAVPATAPSSPPSTSSISRPTAARLLVPNAAGAWYSPTGHLLYTDRAGGLLCRGVRPETAGDDHRRRPGHRGRRADQLGAVGVRQRALLVAAGGSASSELMWVARDGRAEPVDSSWRAEFDYPALSPDGKALAVSVRDGATQLWIRRADGTRQKLTQERDASTGGRPGRPMAGRIAFISNMSGRREPGRLRCLPHAGGRQCAARAAPAAHLRPVGGGAVARRAVAGGPLRRGGSLGNIRGRRLRGDTALVPLVVDKNDQQPGGALSRWPMARLHLGRDRAARDLRRPIPRHEVDPARLAGGGTEPRWAHSGRELFFKGGGQLMAVDVMPGADVHGRRRPGRSFR